MAAASHQLCTHISIDPTTSACRQCGKILQSHVGKITEYSDRQQAKTKNQKTQTLFSPKDYIELQISPDLLDLANNISSKFKGARRNRNLKLLKRKFVSLYLAHLESGMVFDPEVLAKKLKLDPQKISSALTLFSQLQTGYVPNIDQETDPKHPSVDLAQAQARELGLNSDACEEIQNMIETALEINPELNRRVAKTIAAAAIKVYLQDNGVVINKDKYQQVISVSEATIKDVSSLIEKAWNE